jgi:hypothetical protein
MASGGTDAARNGAVPAPRPDREHEDHPCLFQPPRVTPKRAGQAQRSYLTATQLVLRSASTQRRAATLWAPRSARSAFWARATSTATTGASPRSRTRGLTPASARHDAPATGATPAPVAPRVAPPPWRQSRMNTAILTLGAACAAPDGARAGQLTRMVEPDPATSTPALLWAPRSPRLAFGANMKYCHNGAHPRP